MAQAKEKPVEKKTANKAGSKTARPKIDHIDRIGLTPEGRAKRWWNVKTPDGALSKRFSKVYKTVDKDNNGGCSVHRTSLELAEKFGGLVEVFTRGKGIAVASALLRAQFKKAGFVEEVDSIQDGLKSGDPSQEKAAKARLAKVLTLNAQHEARNGQQAESGPAP